jgi:hypothetical protein
MAVDYFDVDSERHRSQGRNVVAETKLEKGHLKVKAEPDDQQFIQQQLSRYLVDCAHPDHRDLEHEYRSS